MENLKRRATACHEAGHAVIGRMVGLPCGKVTIVGDDQHELGHAIVVDPIRTWERGDGPRRPLVEASCISLYSGAEAERVILGVAGDAAGDGPDCSKATSLIMIIGVRGASYVGDDVWERYEARLRRRSNELVRLHQDRIVRVAKALEERGTLEGDEVDAIMSDQPHH